MTNDITEIFQKWWEYNEKDLRDELEEKLYEKGAQAERLAYACSLFCLRQSEEGLARGRDRAGFFSEEVEENCGYFSDEIEGIISNGGDNAVDQVLDLVREELTTQVGRDLEQALRTFEKWDGKDVREIRNAILLVQYFCQDGEWPEAFSQHAYAHCPSDFDFDDFGTVQPIFFDQEGRYLLDDGDWGKVENEEDEE